MCPVACSLFGIIAQIWEVVKGEYYSFNDSYSFLFFSYSQVSYLLHIIAQIWEVVKCSSNILNIQVSIGSCKRIFNCWFYFYNLIVALLFRFKCLFKGQYVPISYIIRYFRYFKIIKEIRS